MPAHQVDLKIVLLGDNAVGKSSLALRFANNSFIPCLEATIGSAYISRRLEVGNRKLVLGVWDTAGSERYDAMTKLYYRGAQAAVVCYDATSPKSLKKVKYWIGELRSVEECCKIYICVTKKDLIAYSDPGTMKNLEDVENYANGVQSKFYTTSSKTGENVAELFQDIATDCASMIKDRSTQKLPSEFISLSTDTKRSTCCPLAGHN